MRVTPISAEVADENAGAFDPFPPGDYDFIVSEAEDTVSGAGNEQIKLTLHVFNRDQKKRVVFDYLSSAPKAQWKVRHFAEAVGMLREYETGDMPTHQMINRPGRCKVGIKPADGQYSAQNRVNDYIPHGGSSPVTTSRPIAAAARQKAPAGDLDDEIPF